MLFTLAFRHLWVRKGRSLFLLFGFSLGVGVMVVLLSVGEAMLDQSRDVALVGGGELTVLPQGIDIEAMRTGGGGAFFAIDRARFLTRQTLGGPRYEALVRAVSPEIEGKLVYLCKAGRGCHAVAVRAGGEIPSRAAAVGTGLNVLRGRWSDSRSDSSYIAPSLQRLYDELDRFHIPKTPDSTWAEWQYYNVVTAPGEWWYLTFLVHGKVPAGEWDGGILLTHRNSDGHYERFITRLPGNAGMFDTTRADLHFGTSHVRQRDGVYRLEARASGSTGAAVLDLAITPLPNRYFPAVDLGDESLVSGYVVPALAATASGTICVSGRCRKISDAPAYHDHNWGVWQNVTWEWGAAQGKKVSILYGGVQGGDGVASPFFLTLLDSLGVRQILRFDSVEYRGGQRVAGSMPVSAPRELTLLATRMADTVRLEVQLGDVLASPAGIGGTRGAFLQMRGRFRLEGHIEGNIVADSGSGFFETYVNPDSGGADPRVQRPRFSRNPAVR